MSQSENPNQSMQQPEIDFYAALTDKKIEIDLMDGSDVYGILIATSKFALIVQRHPDEFPMLVYKHSIQAVKKYVEPSD